LRLERAGREVGDVTTTPAVRFVPLSPATLDALLQGDLAAASASAGALLPASFLQEGWLWRLRLDQVRTDPQAAPWVVRAVAVLSAGPVVGHAGFHGPPDEHGAVEVGYTVVPELRGRGYARAALAALVAEARACGDVRVVRASVSPDNVASLAIVREAGFVEVGEQEDEDGVELVHELVVDEGQGSCDLTPRRAARTRGPA
jgi:ribosomal-protein-alanine N-acetyltransferase